MFNATVRPRIADERRARGWTQAELGDRIGMTQGQVSNLERGVNVPSGIGTAFAIADALGVDVRVLWPGLAEARCGRPQHRQPEAAGRRRSGPARAAKNQGKSKR